MPRDRIFHTIEELQAELAKMRPVSRAEQITERLSFPNLSASEVAIWQKFIAANPAFAITTLYDILIGVGADLGPDADPATRHLAKLLSMKRIDAVQILPDCIRIFEIKPNAGLAGFGQLLSYRALWIIRYGPEPPIDLWLITDVERADMRTTATALGVHYVVTG